MTVSLTNNDLVRNEIIIDSDAGSNFRYSLTRPFFKYSK